MKGQRTAANPAPRAGRLGVVGDVPNPVREELERATEQLPVREINLGKLQDNPFQYLARPKLDEDALNELADSIRQNGFYGALLARRKRGADEQYEIAYGHRRREAAGRAGIQSVPVKVVELSDSQMARIMASENFSREDLTPMGEANVVGYLATMQNMTNEQIAEVVGKGKSWVQQRVALYEAPTDIKEMVEQKPETFSQVRLLRQVKDENKRAILIQAILEKGLTVEQVRNRLEELREEAEQLDKKITSDGDDIDSENGNKVSRESIGSLEASREQIQRLDALLRLEKAAAKFERLASESGYKLSKEEKRKLADVVEGLSSLLHN